jgi:hypothetical protein
MSPNPLRNHLDACPVGKPGLGGGLVRHAGRSTGHCSTRPGIVHRAPGPRSIRHRAGMGCLHRRYSNLCLNCQIHSSYLFELQKPTTHHSIHLRLAGGGLGLHTRHCGHSMADLGRPDNTNPYFLVDDGRSHHHNDPAVGVPT